MHRQQHDMQPVLAEALNLLDFNAVQLRNEQGEKTDTITAREHAKALFTYLNMAGYLGSDLLTKAVGYLSAVKPFACPNEKVVSDLIKLVEASNAKDGFDAEHFITHFGKEGYLAVDDIIDLITFLQQTAFDRQFGVERDRLTVKSWMEEHKEAFLANAAKLGILNPVPPLRDQYAGSGVMGASTHRVKPRMLYFRELAVECELVLALSGGRELSKGLDEEAVMEKVAHSVGKPVNYIVKPVGVDKREFLDGVTETMMVNYFIQELCPDKKMGMIDSGVEAGHWRATSSQSAADVAPVIINKILSHEIKQTNDGQYYFMIIAEQPYAGRMARQMQREFNRVLNKMSLSNQMKIIVEGCGPGLTNERLANPQVMASLNSELGALMAERFNDARLILQQRPGLVLRDPNILMFSKREQTYKLCEQQEEKSVNVLK